MCTASFATLEGRFDWSSTPLQRLNPVYSTISAAVRPLPCGHFWYFWPRPLCIHHHRFKDSFYNYYWFLPWCYISLISAVLWLYPPLPSPLHLALLTLRSSNCNLSISGRPHRKCIHPNNHMFLNTSSPKRCVGYFMFHAKDFLNTGQFMVRHRPTFVHDAYTVSPADDVCIFTANDSDEMHNTGFLHGASAPHVTVTGIFHRGCN